MISWFLVLVVGSKIAVQNMPDATMLGPFDKETCMRAAQTVNAWPQYVTGHCMALPTPGEKVE